MAAPNLLSLTTINGKTATLAITTSAQTLVNNAAASGKLIKVDSIYVTNVDGTNAATVTVNHYSQDDVAGTATALASTLNVAPDSTVVLVTRDAPIYLEEDMSITVTAGTANDLEVLVSYEEIS